MILYLLFWLLCVTPTKLWRHQPIFAFHFGCCKYIIFYSFFALALLFLGVVPYTQDCSASFAPSACILFHSFPGLSHDCRWRCTLRLRLHLAWDACCESLRQAPILSLRLGDHFSVRAPLCDYFSAGAPLLGASSRRRSFHPFCSLYSVSIQYGILCKHLTLLV